jgi:hypothetical protein
VLYVIGLPGWIYYVIWTGRSTGFSFEELERSFLNRRMKTFFGDMEDGGAEQLDQVMRDCVDDEASQVMNGDQFNTFLKTIGAELSSQVQLEQLILHITKQEQGFTNSEDIQVPFSAIRKTIGAEHAAFDAKYRPFWMKFKPEKAHFEMMLALQVILILAAKCILSPHSSYFAAFVTLQLLIYFFAEQARERPYKTDRGNQVAFVCFLVLITLLTSAMALGCLPQGFIRELIQHFIYLVVTLGVLVNVYVICLEVVAGVREAIKQRMLDTVSSIPIFTDCSSEFVELVSLRFDKQTHEDGHVFATMGETGDRMVSG